MGFRVVIPTKPAPPFLPIGFEGGEKQVWKVAWMMRIVSGYYRICGIRVTRK
jgi:hypothetical protein